MAGVAIAMVKRLSNPSSSKVFPFTQCVWPFHGRTACKDSLCYDQLSVYAGRCCRDHLLWMHEESAGHTCGMAQCTHVFWNSVHPPTLSTPHKCCCNGLVCCDQCCRQAELNLQYGIESESLSLRGVPLRRFHASITSPTGTCGR